MSIESTKAFYSHMATDEVFRTQLEKAASKEERQQILQAASYNFTLEDWQAAKAQYHEFQQMYSSTDSELSNADLQVVSGGLMLPAYSENFRPSIRC